MLALGILKVIYTVAVCYMHILLIGCDQGQQPPTGFAYRAAGWGADAVVSFVVHVGVGGRH